MFSSKIIIHHKNILTCVPFFRIWKTDNVSGELFIQHTTIHIMEERIMSTTTASPSAETVFTEEMHQTIEKVGHMLKAYFRTLNDSHLETLLLICLGMFLNAGNIYHMLQLLGLPKTTTYNRVKNVSVYYWRQLLQHRLYEIAIPLLLERLTKSDASKSRDGLILAVDDTVIARIATELGYVWRWWSGQLKRVAAGQNVIALILVIGDIILPLDVRIVSKQGKGLKSKPEIYREMLAAAKSRFEAAGIDFSVFKTTGDAAYLKDTIADYCRGDSDIETEATEATEATETTETTEATETTETTETEKSPTITGIFGGKASYVFTIDGKRQKAGQWRKDFKDLLKEGWGTDGQPVYRTAAESPTFGSVILLFYIPKGKRAVSYLMIIGRPLRSSEALHAFAFHHRIEEFWKLLKDTLELGDMHLQDREGAYACVGIKIISYFVVNMMKQNLRKLKRFRNITINKIVNLCPTFVDMRQIFKEHFHDVIPENYSLDEALAR